MLLPRQPYLLTVRLCLAMDGKVQNYDPSRTHVLGGHLASKEIVLVCATDSKFAMGASVMLYSALVHLRPNTSARLFVFDDGLGPQLRERLTRVVERAGVPVTVEWIPIGVCADRDTRLGNVLRAPYARLDAGTALPSSIERAIYLDCDMLVQRDLAELYLADMADSAFLAVQDYHVPDTSQLPFVGPAGLTTAPARPAGPYFNSGLLVIDLPRWRELDLGAKAIQLLADHQRQKKQSDSDVNTLTRLTPLYADQTALNAVAAGQWSELDLKWNVQTLVLRYPVWICEPVRRRLGSHLGTPRKTARIIHYTGPKPWNSMVLEPLAWRWWAYCRRSGWFTPARGLLEQALWVSRTGWHVAQDNAKRSWRQVVHA